MRYGRRLVGLTRDEMLFEQAIAAVREAEDVVVREVVGRTCPGTAPLVVRAAEAVRRGGIEGRDRLVVEAYVRRGEELL